MVKDELQTVPWRSPWSWGVPLFAALAMLALWGLDANRPLFLWLNQIAAQGGATLWQVITTFGDSLVIFSLALLLVGRRPLLLWSLLLAAFIATVLVHGLKEWSDAYEIYRPPYFFGPDVINIIGTPFRRVSFPSGHTAAAFALASVLCLQGWLRLRWKLLLLGAALLVGLSRVAVGVHWPMDVLGGALTAWLSALVALRLAPQIPWGTGTGAQRLFALLLIAIALQLLFAYDSGYPQTRWLEIAVAAGSLAAAAPRLKALFARTPEERQAEARLEDPEPVEPRSLGGLLLRLAVTVLIMVLIFRSIDLGGVAQSLRGIAPRLLLLGLVFQMFSTLLASYRWYLVMQSLGFGRDFTFYLRSYFKGAFFNQGLPTSIGGDAVRVLDVARLGFRKREAFYGVFIDRVLGLVGLLVLNLLANVLNPELLPRQAFLAINTLVLLGLGGFVALLFLRRLDWLRRWGPTRVFHTISGQLPRVLGDLRRGGAQLALSLAVHLLSLLAIFLIGRSVMLEYDLLTFLVIVPPVILLTLVPVSLAGWGVREGAMIGLFTLIGANQGAVLSMSVLYGLVLIVSSLPGFVVYLTGRHRI